MTTRKWSKAWGAAIGFALLAAYIVVPEGIKIGWHQTVGYYIGTAIGAGAVGAVIGWLVCFLQNKRSN